MVDDNVEVGEIFSKGEYAKKAAGAVFTKLQENDPALANVNDTESAAIRNNVEGFFQGIRPLEEIGFLTSVANKIDFDSAREIVGEKVADIYQANVQMNVREMGGEALKNARMNTGRQGLEVWYKPTPEGYEKISYASINVGYNENGVFCSFNGELSETGKKDGRGIDYVRVKALDGQGKQVILDNAKYELKDEGTTLWDVLLEESCRAYNRQVARENGVDYIDPTERNLKRPKLQVSK